MLEFAIIMDISISMKNLVKKYINIIIPGILTNLKYHIKQVHYLHFKAIIILINLNQVILIQEVQH
jgi:hypothetical protein